MALSKSTRILILLGIDAAFFLLELVVGTAVHSLALVADSFHMLNDVISLCVGFWAVKVANQKTNSKRYTYGWQRAETLGALVNGVFLVALCLSIFLEAIQRLIEPQVVKNPKLILIVGSLGLFSNILGLFLFHNHGHSHGGGHGHGHSHKAKDGLSAAEEGHAHPDVVLSDQTSDLVADEDGNIEDVLPSELLRKSFSTPVPPENGSEEPHPRNSHISIIDPTDTRGPHLKVEPISARKSSSDSKRSHRRHSSGSRGSRHFSSADAINPHPASFRKDFIAASKMDEILSAPASDTESLVDNDLLDDSLVAIDDPPAGPSPNGNGADRRKSSIGRRDRHDSWHENHQHNKPKAEGGKGGHSHDLNMRGVFLHVMGDALGNIGVIASALFIWLTHYSWRYYADPLISLAITAIILASAIPLCKAASRILLQAVPAGLSVDDLKSDIQALPDVVSCHHLHVWQLNDTKLVASLHIQVKFDFKGAGSAQYMILARAVRRCLHAYGIHSSTIQPEFCVDSHTEDQPGALSNDLDGVDDRVAKGKGIRFGSQGQRSGSGSRTGSPGSPDTCLLECGDECGTGDQCCAPNVEGDNKTGHDGHSHPH